MPHLLRLIRIDLRNRQSQPSWPRWLTASLLAVVASLGADALLVVAGTHLFPSINGYVHFRFSDYSKLTFIGVVIADCGWPVVLRISWSPRWLFFRLAVITTLVLWLPDLYILEQGQPGRAVFVLMMMHLVIALITYNALVHLAPPREPGPQRFK